VFTANGRGNPGAAQSGGGGQLFVLVLSFLWGFSEGSLRWGGPSSGENLVGHFFFAMPAALAPCGCGAAGVITSKCHVFHIQCSYINICTGSIC